MIESVSACGCSYDRGQHRHPGTGHAQGGPAQQLLEHPASWARSRVWTDLFWNQSRVGRPPAPGRRGGRAHAEPQVPPASGICRASGASRTRGMPPRGNLLLQTPACGTSRGGRIRTGDFSLPKRARYQAAPRPVAHSLRAGCRARPAGEQDDEPARAVDAFHPIELDVTGRGRTGDEDDRPPVASSGLEEGEELRHGLDDLRPPRTTHTCRSGTSVSARRPCPGPPVSAIVPVSAHAPAQQVRAPSSSSSSAGRVLGPRPARRRTAGAGEREIGRDADRPALDEVTGGTRRVGRRHDDAAVLLDPIDESRDDVVLVQRAAPTVAPLDRLDDCAVG